MQADLKRTRNGDAERKSSSVQNVFELKMDTADKA